MRTEPFTGPFPWGFTTLALASIMWICSGLQPRDYQEGYTVRAKTSATVIVRKEGLIPPDLLEDAIKTRLQARPAKFKRKEI